MVLPSQLRWHAVSLKMQTHVLPMLTVRGTRLKRANALFLSPTISSMAKKCASSLHWHLATELILNFQHTDANMRLAPGDMISVDPAAIHFFQEPESSKTESSDTDSNQSPRIPLSPVRPQKPHFKGPP
jgi:hypothetical protein